jgi:hypothetical protein
MVLLAAGCPPLMHLLVGAGAGQDEKKDPEYDLSRFGKGKPEAEKPVKRGPTEAEIAHLRELEAELEQRLAGRTDSSDAPTPSAGGGAASQAQPQQAQQQQQQQPIKKLDGGPLEVQGENKPKQQKRFGGEFYPTETHVKQDRDEKDKK